VFGKRLFAPGLVVPPANMLCNPKLIFDSGLVCISNPTVFERPLGARIDGVKGDCLCPFGSTNRSLGGLPSFERLREEGGLAVIFVSLRTQDGRRP